MRLLSSNSEKPLEQLELERHLRSVSEGKRQTSLTLQARTVRPREPAMSTMSSLPTDVAVLPPPLPKSLAELPRPRAEEPLYEFVNGQRVEIPPMSTLACLVANRIHFRLHGFADEQQLGSAWSETL